MATVIHIGGSLIRAGLFVFAPPQPGPEPGPAAVTAPTATTSVARLGSLEVAKGMQESFVTADVIGNMIIGPGAGGAIVQSQIWATERIDSAVIVGDTVDSRIFASPIVVGDTGDGPMSLAEKVRPVSRLITVVVRVGNRLRHA